MTTPVLDAKIRLDEFGIPSWAGPRPIRLAANQDINLSVTLEQIDLDAMPPAYVPVDISGWTAKWACKASIDDDDGDALFNVEGTITTGTDGRITFTVPAADIPDPGQLLPSEFVLLPSSTPEVRVGALITLLKPVITV